MMAIDHAIPASIEMMAQQIVNADDLAGLFPPGTPVYMPHMGDEADSLFVVAARRLLDFGYDPVPHIAVRRIKDRAALAARLDWLSSETQVSNVLVIGGGAGRPEGEFASTMQVLETGLLDRYGIRRIGVAGHPDGSPDFSDETAEQALVLKQAFRDRSDADLRIVTQFAFDDRAILNWTQGLAQRGIDLPVHIGVAGPCQLPTLIKYATMCGVGNSLKILKKQAGSMIKLASGFSPESVVAPIEAHWRTHPGGAIQAIHVFAFGGRKKAAEWLKARGSWT